MSLATIIGPVVPVEPETVSPCKTRVFEKDDLMTITGCNINGVAYGIRDTRQIMVREKAKGGGSSSRSWHGRCPLVPWSLLLFGGSRPPELWLDICLFLLLRRLHCIVFERDFVSRTRADRVMPILLSEATLNCYLQRESAIPTTGGFRTTSTAYSNRTIMLNSMSAEIGLPLLLSSQIIA